MLRLRSNRVAYHGGKMMGTFSQKQSTMNIKNINSLNGNLGGRPHKIRTFIASLYGDNLQRLANFAASLKAYSNEALVESYNKNFRTGPFGVNAQNVYMVALHREFESRFGKSPMTCEHDYVVTLSHFIMLEGNTWVFVFERT